MTFLRPLFLLVLLSVGTALLYACDRPDTKNQTPLAAFKKSEPAAQQAEPVATVGGTTPAPSNAAQQQAATDAVNVAQASSSPNYTFRGTVLLPPDVYTSNEADGLDKTNVCGITSPDQQTGEKYCFTFAELHSHLYDADHPALDVWDIRGDWYLLLTKEDRRELWIQKDKFGVYHPYADIISQKLLYLGDWNYKIEPTWPLQAYNGPDGAVIELNKEKYPNLKSQSPMVAITSVAQSDKKDLWFRLNLINSLCETTEGQDMTPVVMNIWYPAYRQDENGLYIPTVWYYAKGC